MHASSTHHDLCRHFAVLLSYPSERIAEQAASCLTRLRDINPGAALSLERFLGFVEANDICRIEEAFTGTFDLQSLCHPYVGYQLCGESQQRTMFMIKLQEIYRQHEFIPGNELPDHMAEVLRFVGSIADQECRLEIIRDGLLPALNKISQGIASDDHPYMALLDALQGFLRETGGGDSADAQTGRQKECLS